MCVYGDMFNYKLLKFDEPITNHGLGLGNTNQCFVSFRLVQFISD